MLPSVTCPSRPAPRRRRAAPTIWSFRETVPWMQLSRQQISAWQVKWSRARTLDFEVSRISTRKLPASVAHARNFLGDTKNPDQSRVLLWSDDDYGARFRKCRGEIPMSSSNAPDDWRCSHDLHRLALGLYPVDRIEQRAGTDEVYPVDRGQIDRHDGAALRELCELGELGCSSNPRARRSGQLVTFAVCGLVFVAGTRRVGGRRIAAPPRRDGPPAGAPMTEAIARKQSRTRSNGRRTRRASARTEAARGRGATRLRRHPCRA